MISLYRGSALVASNENWGLLDAPRLTAAFDRVGAFRLAGAESRDIALKAGGRELNFKGFAYLETYAKPNFFFHLTTAYAILRHNGIELGKPDFLAGGQ